MKGGTEEGKVSEKERVHLSDELSGVENGERGRGSGAC